MDIVIQVPVCIHYFCDNSCRSCIKYIKKLSFHFYIRCRTFFPKINIYFFLILESTEVNVTIFTSARNYIGFLKRLNMVNHFHFIDRNIFTFKNRQTTTCDKLNLLLIQGSLFMYSSLHTPGPQQQELI